MKISLSVILLLFGVQLVSASFSRMQKMIRALPQTKQLDFSCTTAIDRINSALPDYKSIVSTSSDFWNDNKFPADATSIQWTGTRYTENLLTGFINNKWERLNNFCPTCTLFGTSDFLGDIDQGGLGDCYLLAGVSAVGELNSRFEKAFVNPEINWAGLYAFNVYIRGIPHVLVVDDAIPAGDYGKKPAFASFGSDGSIWGPLLEKAFAKVNSNYEEIKGGQVNEAFSFMASVPSDIFKLNDLSIDSIWTLVSQADAKNWVMGISSPSSPGGDKDRCNLNLPCGHAYSLLGVATVYNQDRSQAINLFKIRNPWRKDADFTGSFSDNSTVWSTIGADGLTYSQQIQLVIADDGVFYMTVDEVKGALSGFTIGKYTQNFVTSWYDKRNDQVANETTPSTFQFTLTESTPMYIRVMIYPKRMYPFSCKSDSTKLKLILQDASGSRVQYFSSFESNNPYIDLVDTPLAAGTYTLKFYPKWTNVDVRDYGIIIDAPIDITITDANGQISRLTGHDFNNKELKPTVDQAPKKSKPQLPDILQSGPAYVMTGDLDQDIVNIRFSSSLQITDSKGNGVFLQGSVSNVNKKSNRQILAYFLGTQTETKTYNGQMTIKTKPGYYFKYSLGNDKCGITPASKAGEKDIIQCSCVITPDFYPKECLLVLATSPGEGTSTSNKASASS
ncbi:calpain family cysteine protease containing protein [Stylonychia lemnae]|uniref:Calpain family cysteine protease containing protein n=1 Tax=Stylonychia lemnae TaxID=5949 RepID=A0A078AGF2_STYLE|nr:calpain family cysteine protease containing protein [Stylonychia lemnae]|eukprot:CDW81319.1 calpain family cysteine protease containing protein [Stylonychia lemnae]